MKLSMVTVAKLPDVMGEPPQLAQLHATMLRAAQWGLRVSHVAWDAERAALTLYFERVSLRVELK